MRKAIFGSLALMWVSAANAGAYFGGGIGTTKVKDVEVDDFGPGVSTDVDDEDSGFRVLLGYQANENVAVELSYEDLGEVGVHYSDGWDYINITSTAKAITVSALGMVALQGDAYLFGRIGLSKVDVDVDLRSSFGTSASVSDSDTETVFGVGLQYDFSESAFLRAEFNRYTEVGGDDTGESDVDLIMIGAGARF